MMTRTLRPGMLVSLKTSIKGGIEYARTEIEPTHITADGAARAKWETIKRVEDPEETEKAIKVRGSCRTVITGVCARSDFGLLCPEDKAPELIKAIEEAQRLAAEFNEKAARTRIEVYAIMGRIETDDARAARAINAEIRDLIDAMQDGIKAADPSAIREAANKARQVGSMLSDEAAGKVNAAIEEARKAAREIVKRVEKSGEVAATVVGEIKIKALTEARFAFLDLDEPAAAPAEPIAATGHALDLPTEAPAGAPEPAAAAPAPAATIELFPSTEPAAPSVGPAANVPAIEVA